MKEIIDYRMMSLCSVIVEQKLLRITSEDLEDVLFDRLKDNYERVTNEGIEVDPPNRKEVISLLHPLIRKGIKDEILEKREEFIFLTQKGEKLGTQWMKVVEEQRER